ncbi:uncharacterized protein ARMOST_02178 [Armillaria ostoyae]|uniref:Uncharacterized protein n=1 Tax=Armillaria ostoyae TaxID=47428 RepID=A0A284QQZ6_ARMOS|nr:uncharacterized protein ARMOST_02178 [Armillaria ostoyae]
MDSLTYDSVQDRGATTSIDSSQSNPLLDDRTLMLKEKGQLLGLDRLYAHIPQWPWPKVLSGRYHLVLTARLCATFAKSVVPATTGLKHDAPLHIHYPRRLYWGHRLTAYQQNVYIPPTLLL